MIEAEDRQDDDRENPEDRREPDGSAGDDLEMAQTSRTDDEPAEFHGKFRSALLAQRRSATPGPRAARGGYPGVA